MPSAAGSGLSNADVQRIAERVAVQLSGRSGGGGKGHDMPLARRDGGGKAKGKGKGSNGKGSGGGNYGSNWQCFACGEHRNFGYRTNCFRCQAPRHDSDTRAAASSPKPRSPAVAPRGSLTAAQSGPLRPRAAAADVGPVGADGQRPLFRRHVEDEARKKQLQQQQLPQPKKQSQQDPHSAAEDGQQDGADDEGFLLLARAAGVWPRVGGADRGKPRGGAAAGDRGKSPHAAPSSGGPGKAQGDDDDRTQPSAVPKPQNKRAAEADTPIQGPSSTSVARRAMPSRPPWADEELEDDQWPQQHDHMDDDGDWYEDQGDDQWDEEDADDDAEGEEAQEDDADVEVLRERWAQRRDILAAVRTQFKKGQPQFDTAKREAAEAYDKWQQAKRAASAPRLANLHQRRQRALDHAERLLQKDMDSAEREIERHNKTMEEIKARIGERQRKVDEARERLHEVMQQVGVAAAEEGENGKDAGDHGHLREHTAIARDRIRDVGARLQEILGQLEAEGHSQTCVRLNELHDHLIEASKGVEKVEWAVAGTVHHAMDQDAEDDDESQAEARGGKGGAPPRRDEGTASSSSAGKWRRTKGSGGKAPSTAMAADARGKAQEQKPPSDGDGAAAAHALAPPTVAAAAADGPTDVFFNGAANLEQEMVELRAAAKRSVRQAVLHFASAPAGKDTDDAALLYAHQNVLTNVGVPSNVVEMRAFDRWRAALANFVIEEAATRAARPTNDIAEAAAAADAAMAAQREQQGEPM